MKRKPFILTIYSLVYFAIAISIPAQIMVLYGHGPSEWPLILHKITISNWVVIGLSLLNSFLAYTTHRWLLPSTILSIVAVAINNTLVAMLGFDYHLISTVVSTLLFTTFSGAIYFMDARRVLSNPQLCWWKIASRSKINLPLKLELPDGRQIIDSMISFDISSSGLFAVSKSLEDVMALNCGQPVKVTIAGNNGNLVQCSSRVVRKSGALGDYPAGVGIKFEGLNWWQALKLDHYSRNYA